MDATPSTSVENSRAASVPRVGRFGRALLWVMALHVVCAIAAMGIYRPLTTYGVDWGKHWEAARAVLEGRNPYILEDLWIGFNYPQAAAIVFAWIGLFPFDLAQSIWKATLVALTIGCWWLAWRAYRPGAPAGRLVGPGGAARSLAAAHWGLVTAFILSLYRPVTSCIYLGNIDPYNAFLAVAMVAAILTRRERAAGVAWGMLTLCKMMPIALIVPVVLWRRWRMLQGLAATLIVYFVVLLATGRLGYEWYFVREAVPAIPLWWRSISISPLHFTMYLMGLEETYQRDPYVYMQVARAVESVTIALYVGLVVWLRRRRVEWTRALEPLMLAYPFASPLLEYHHFVWMLPVLVLQVKRWAEGRMGGREAGALLAGWVMMQVGYDVSFARSQWGLWVHFLGMLAAAGVLAVTIWTTLRATTTNVKRETEN